VYNRALDAHEVLLAAYLEASAKRRKKQLQRYGSMRGKRPAAANTARTERRRASPLQQKVNRDGARARRAVQFVESNSLASGEYADWPTRLLTAHARLQNRQLTPPEDVSRAIVACASVGANVKLLCSRPCATKAAQVNPVVLVAHGTTVASALVIFEKGFAFSLKGRAVPPGTRVPAVATGAVCFGAAMETALLFAKKDGSGHGALVLATAHLSPEHWKVSACSGGTVVAFDTAVAAGQLTVVAVLQLEQPVRRWQLNEWLRIGRSSTNKGEWEQSASFTGDFERLLTHVTDVPEGWRLDERYTWRSGREAI